MPPPTSSATPAVPARYRSQLVRHLDRHFGGRRAFALHILALVEIRLPSWRAARAVDLGRVDRLVFVCSGNICRSPYAAAKAAALGLPAISAGLDAKPGMPANEVACRAAAARGISLADHRTQRFAGSLIGPADLLLGMEPRHVRQLRAAHPALAAQVSLLGLWTEPWRPCIYDPYGAPDDYWNICFDVIDLSVERLAAAVREISR